MTSQQRDNILGELDLSLMLKPILCPYLSKNHTDAFFPQQCRYVHACLEKIFHILGLQKETLPSLRPGSREPVHGNCLCPWQLHHSVADPNLVTLFWVICFRSTCLTAGQPALELRIHSLQVQRVWMPSLLTALSAAYLLRCRHTLLHLINCSQVSPEEIVGILKTQ